MSDYGQRPKTASAEPPRCYGPGDGRLRLLAVDFAVPGRPARHTMLARMLDLLEREEGATLADLCAATGWQAHSVRGAIAGNLKRRGIAVLSSRDETGTRRYRSGGTR